MSNWNVLWKFGGILLLAYVIVVGFGTPSVSYTHLTLPTTVIV